MSNKMQRLGFYLWLLLATNAFAAPPISEFEGLIEPNMTVELRSSVDGVIESIAVDRSAVVKQGQELVKLRAGVEEAALALAETKSEFDKRKQSRAQQLYAKNAIPFSDKDEADANARISEQQMRHARETLNLRIIRSPISGVVAERYLSPGESVKDKTILKLVQINPLRIELVLPASAFGQIQKGMSAQVQPELGSVGPLNATVTVVDKVIDGASGTFAVRLEIPNPTQAIPSGLRCKVRFAPH
ncbi:MAG: efflux RND transporter periplasmic adaptor subunit [Gammaproteobacteria bacterium]|nr:efflux RND transporter periplasmic adaptor subunit [Gammaproteobacteria bacterium]